MKLTDVAHVVSGQNPHFVDARKIYESPHAVAVVITLMPGEALEKHVTQVDIFFYVVEGSGFIETGEKQTVVKDMLVESALRSRIAGLTITLLFFRVLVVKVQKSTKRQNCSDP
jgi:hypothetical protein